ncbi:MAG: VPLPA-CTERM sorting domain-containing protein [Rhodobacteraceae bacterium]|nr:VPLPA-CTERM sorting domain-containing protein [Paracoccaceae bacterium]
MKKLEKWNMNMKLKSFLIAGAALVASTLSSSAATYNLGDATGGATFANVLKVRTVDLIQFSLDAPSSYALSGLDISMTSKAGSNLRESIGLYFGSTLLATATSSVAGNAATLSFSGIGTLAEGSYTLGVAGWKASFTPDLANVSSSAFFGNGSYTVSITPSISVVPLPAGGMLLLTALGALGLARRTKRAA